ncbi:MULTISPECIES: hypothetical protein [unclassified Methylophaga]|jgi:hypothetical protein|uniref:phage tail tube protein n=1 Tax=unclassified Methylophaga TaxID=2629249 RepID=UPI000C8E8BC9|nr:MULTISPECIES: hypothetical protein [unclassified Methylophaga]MAK67509.1 hypothetical protein [Methylophaga sp.]MAY18742.1 hypothetical protein [Methylophaga sp.]HAO23508.1 hypothetical protein [Methylophaga sp.]HCD04468.1 hypothetical protein [Methylophaga sp.]|tara:strand:+ start:20302 stop:21054 length:753 start_codon:yes stop_codon:yes gene_type:complete
MAGLIAEGTLYLNRKVNGVAQGIVRVPGVTRFSIQPASERLENRSKDKGKYGQVTDTVVLPQPTVLGISIGEVDGESLAIALMGDLETIDVTAGSVTDEEVTTKGDRFVKLDHKNITAESVVVTGADEVTVFEEGTDYEINYSLGLILALSSGAITEGEVVTLDYDHGPIAGSRINGSTRPEVRGEFILDGRNLADGKELSITVDEAVVAAESEVDFMSDEFVLLEMSGTMNTLQGKNAPYTVDYGLTTS